MSYLGDRLLERKLLRHRLRFGSALNQRRRALVQGMMRRRAAPTYIGDGVVLTTVLGRYKMYVPGGDMSLAAHLIAVGYWELWVVETLAAILRRPMVAADVGANLGVFALMMADFCRDGAVHAFEPNPAIADFLRRNLTINGMDAGVVLHDVALGDVEGGQAYLVVPERQAGGAHVVAADSLGSRPGVALTTRRLDRMAGARDAEVVKIDAEGAESAIWIGMAEMIAGTRLHIVLMEFAAVRYPDPVALLRDIRGAGFSITAIDHIDGERLVSDAELLTAGEHMLLLRR